MWWRTLLILTALGAASGEAAAEGTDRFGDPLPRGAVARLGTLRNRHAPDFDLDMPAIPEGIDAGRYPWLGNDPDRIARSGDGRLAAAYFGEAHIMLWDEKEGRRLRTLVGHEEPVESLLFIHGGKLLLSGAEDLTVRLWDPATGTEIRRFDLPEGPAARLALSPDGGAVLVMGWLGTRRFDLHTGRELDPDAGHLGEVEFVAVSADGRTAATAAGGRTIFLWDLETGRRRRVIRGHVEPVSGLAFSPDGRILASTDLAGAVRFSDPETGRSRRARSRHYMRACRAAFSPVTGELITGGTWARLRVWHALTGSPRGWIPAHQNEDWEKQEILALACDPLLPLAATAAADGRIEVHSLTDGERVLESAAPSEPAAGLSFRPGIRHLAVVEGAGALTVRDLTNLEILAERKGAWLAAAYSPGGGMLAAGNAEGELHLLDPEDLETVTRVKAHSDAVSALAFSPDGRRLVTGCADGTLLVFDVEALAGRAPGEPPVARPSPPRPVDPPPSPPTGGRVVGLGPGESMRPYPGFVPGAAPPGFECILVVDGTTGRPVEGAEVLRYSEAGPPGQLVSGATTDEFGLAFLDCRDAYDDDQWVVAGEGFAAQSRLRRHIPEMTALFPGRTVRGRLVDPFGQRLPGIRVELFVGCGHSPAVSSAVTDEEGVFTLRNVNRNEGGYLWFVGRGLASEYLRAGASWAGSEGSVEFVTRPGVSLRLRVVEPDGTPVPGCTLKAEQTNRGPYGITGRDGRCRMIGIEAEGTVDLGDPWPDGSRLGEIPVQPWFAAGRERVVVRPPIGRGIEDLAERRAVEFPVVAVDAETGEVLPHLPVTAVSLATGARYDAWGFDEEEPEARPSALFAPEGRYLLGAGGPLDSHSGGPVEVEIVRDRREPCRIPVRRNARLALDVQDLPESCTLRLVLPGEEQPELDVDEEGPVYLPATGPAAVHVVGERVLTFPVGPVREGLRRVRIRLTDAERNAVDPPDRWDGESAETSERPEEETRLGLPGGEPAPGVRFRVWDEELTGISEPYWDDDGSDVGGRIRVTRGASGRALLEVRRNDLVPLLRPLGREVLWGDGSLVLEVAGERGEPLSFALYVDGALGRGVEGRRRLEGLTAGRHTIIVGAPGHHAQVVEIHMAAGGRRKVRIEPSER